jgi:hypothetical protein
LQEQVDSAEHQLATFSARLEQVEKSTELFQRKSALLSQKQNLFDSEISMRKATIGDIEKEMKLLMEQS